MTNSLLMAKVHVPPTLPKLVKRPRLLALLDSPPHLRRITLLSAPPGYGKTTLAADWISQRYQIADLWDDTSQPDEACPRAGWYTLDDHDNDISRFLFYLTLACRTIAPEASEDNRHALESLRLPSTTALLTTVLNEIDERGASVSLVLDDYQQIEDSRVHEAVAFLLEHQPACLHIIIISRVDPPLALALLRSQGRLVEIRQNALQFQLNEVTAFLADTCGFEHDTCLAAQLATRTEGWAAGLQMAAISLQNEGAKSASVDKFTGDHRHIGDYFLDEVLSRQSPDVRQFLLQTSILDQMCASLCDALLHGPDENASNSPTQPLQRSCKVLDYLERSNLFLIPQDSQRLWFRYHHLFAELLQSELTRTAAETVPLLHHRASIWYAANDMPEAAIQHALAAGDYAVAARLIDRVAAELTRRSELRMLQRWLDALPQDLLSHQPRLLTYHAVTHLLGGDPLEVVEEDLDTALDSGTDPSTQATVLILRGLIALYQGRYRAGGQLLRQGMALAVDDQTIWHAVARDELALSQLRHGNRRQAEALLLKSLTIAERTDNMVNRVLALAHLGELAIQECRLDDARWLFSSALDETMRQSRQLPIGGIAQMGLGKIDLELGELTDAAEQLQDGVRLVHAWSDTAAIEGYLNLAAAEALRRRWSDAEQALHQARELAIRFDAMTLDNEMVDWQEVQFWLAHGDKVAARIWLEQQLQIKSAATDASVEYSLPSLQRAMTMARVYLAEAAPDRALALLAQRAEIPEAQLAPRLLIDLYLLEAHALEMLARPLEAQLRCAHALEQAAPQEVLRPFLERACPMLIEVLQRVKPSSAARPFKLKLVSQLSGTEADEKRVQDNRARANHAELTDRETEILTLIAQGLTNQEISTQLVISISTVKTHINNLYRKLGMHSRTRALNQASRMGLLESISTLSPPG